MRGVRSLREVSVGLRALLLIVLALTLAAIAVIDVDGDPTTSNVISVVMTDRSTGEAVPVNASRRLGSRFALRRIRKGSIAPYLKPVQSIWVLGAPTIRGP